MTCPLCHQPCKSLLVDSLADTGGRCVLCWYAEGDAKAPSVSVQATTGASASPKPHSDAECAPVAFLEVQP